MRDARGTRKGGRGATHDLGAGSQEKAGGRGEGQRGWVGSRGTNAFRPRSGKDGGVAVFAAYLVCLA